MYPFTHTQPFFLSPVSCSLLLLCGFGGFVSILGHGMCISYCFFPSFGVHYITMVSARRGVQAVLAWFRSLIPSVPFSFNKKSFSLLLGYTATVFFSVSLLSNALLFFKRVWVVNHFLSKGFLFFFSVCIISAKAPGTSEVQSDAKVLYRLLFFY